MGDADAFVERPAGLALALLVDADIAGREGEVGLFRPGLLVRPAHGTGVRIERLAKPLRLRAFRDDRLPGLRVAPGGGTLRDPKHRLDRRARYLIRLVAAAGVARADRPVERRGIG